MQCTTKRWIVQLALVRLHALVVLSILLLALLGRMPDSQAGWITCPPQVVMVVPARRRQQGGCWPRDRAGHKAACWRQLLHTGHLPVLRSLLLGVLWHLSGQPGPAWVCLVPWAVWLWQNAGVFWPWLGRQPEWRGLGWLLWQGQRGLLVGYLGLALGALARFQLPTCHLPTLGLRAAGPSPWLLGLGCLVCGRPEPWAAVGSAEDGSYTATLCGHFTLRVAGDNPLRVRLLMLFLRLLEVPGPQRGGRRTRDGRTPFVSQEQLSGWLQLPQPDISRVEKYWVEGDWPNLLSLNTAEVLTQEVIGRIVAVFATFPWWGVEKVHQHLRAQGLAVSERQVRQAAVQSGWSLLRQELVKRYHLTAEGLRPRDNWLVEQLLTQVESLLARLEAGEGLTPEEQVTV